MTVLITDNGDGTSTFTLSATAATTKVTDTLGLMAEELWNRALGPMDGEELLAWEGLTNAQKMGMINDYLIQVVRDLAKQRQRENLVDAAKAAAEELENII